MFLSVIGRPRKDKGFNGKVLLERVSKTVMITKMTSHQKNSDDILINSEIKNIMWRNLYMSNQNMTMRELKGIIADTYDLDGFIAERLDLSFEQLVGKNGNKKTASLKDEHMLEIQLMRTDRQ